MHGSSLSFLVSNEATNGGRLGVPSLGKIVICTLFERRMGSSGSGFLGILQKETLLRFVEASRSAFQCFRCFISSLLTLPCPASSDQIIVLSPKAAFESTLCYYLCILFIKKDLRLISLLCSWASTWCHRVTALIGLRWELRGKEHLEKDQACIIVANHQSSLDVLGKFQLQLQLQIQLLILLLFVVCRHV